MIFHTFKNQEERRAFGGSDFLEVQLCRLPQNTDIQNILSGDAFSLWQNDSLYIFGDDWEEFEREYKNILTGGLYPNLQTGGADVSGITYFSQKLTEKIMRKTEEKKPLEGEKLLHFLKNAVSGFYVLGL